RHQAARAAWQRRADGLEARDLGMAAATGGVAAACVARPAAGAAFAPGGSGPELLFLSVPEGGGALGCEGRGTQRLSTGDAVVVPPSLRPAIGEAAESTELLLVTM